MTFKIQLASSLPRKSASDVLVLVLSSTDPSREDHLRDLDARFDGAIARYLEETEFRAERGTSVVLPTLGRIDDKHVVIVGVRTAPRIAGGRTEATSAPLAEAVAIALRACLALKAKRVTVLAAEGTDIEPLVLGARLGAYSFTRYKTEGKKVELEGITVVRAGALGQAEKAAAAKAEHVADGVCLARDLVNEPPNELTPLAIAGHAKKIAARHKLSCKVLEGQAVEKAGLRLHYAVGRGSRNVPAFIHLTYRPKNPVGRLVFIGKGISFDTGGICIKPAPGMGDMKSDMAGAAAVLGLMEAVGALAPNVEVHGIVGAAENMPDGDAYRPADVIESLSGKTVEIINTDAEGRLVLADALTYGARLEPDLMIDAATLTGATLISLGPSVSAFFTSEGAVAEALAVAGHQAGESFWHMPLVEELRQDLDSDVADLKHTGERNGGAITAALFLREFTQQANWLHCDIPGATYRTRAVGMHPKGGTGHAVLTFLQLVELHQKQRIIVAPRAAKAAAKSPGRAIRKKAPSGVSAPKATKAAKKPRGPAKPQARSGRA